MILVAKLRTWIVVAVIAGISILIASFYTFTFSLTSEGGIIGSMDLRTNPTVVYSQAERDYAFERCARDMQNFDIQCNKIKSGEVQVPEKYILTFTMSDEEILNEVRRLPEVQVFNEKYPTAYEVLWREERTAYVKYVEERLRSGGNDSPINESEALHLLVTFDSIGRTTFEYQCGATVTTENVLDTIKNSECPD